MAKDKDIDKPDEADEIDLSDIGKKTKGTLEKSDIVFIPEEEKQRVDIDSLPKKTDILRFRAPHRIMHVFIILSVMTQFYTGIPLRYRNAGWAKWMIAEMGGAPITGLIHRVSGVIMLSMIALHLVWLIYYLVVMKGQFYGDTSMLPRLEDWHQLVGNVKYILGLGPEPKFDRYTYWEKFDWIAVFWGCLAIGITGAMLFAKEYIIAIPLPPQIFNIATIIHSDEAVLAMWFLFIVHWYGAHYSPAKFPINTVVFTGKETREELEHERPLEWERLRNNPDLLEKRLVQPKGEE